MNRHELIAEEMLCRYRAMERVFHKAGTDLKPGALATLVAASMISDGLHDDTNDIRNAMLGS